MKGDIMQTQWVPFTLAWDDHVPIDISFVFERDKPAGARGFLTVDGDRFVFEDGTAARFWGTCFNSGQNFPSHQGAEMVARRLAKFGCNLMRTHQMDAEWATPNIFQFNRARPKDHTRTFDPQSIDRLDYLIHCLKEQGIYIYLDMLTYRQFRPGDEVDAVDELGQAAKAYTYFDPRLIELQKEFARDLWTHINPYTGLAYKDDPAIALTEIVNESDLFTHKPVLEPYRSRLEGMYRAWAEGRGLSVSEGKVDFSAPGDQEAQFLVQVMQDFNADMIEYLRHIGVRVPIAGTNWSRNLGVTAAQLPTDFTDSHCYWNFPLWETGETQTTPMVSAHRNTFATLAFMRLPDRPFFVSEWDHAWPDEWRAESPLAYAAVGALQGWGGLSIHTYRYASWGPVDSIGGGTSTINGITYRNHFDAFNDPAKFGLFYHAALIFRRGDVQPAEMSAAIRIPEDMASWMFKQEEDIPALRWVEKHRVGMLLPGESCAADRVLSLDDVEGLGEDEILSDTGELWRSGPERIGWIDTPRTKAAYGFLGHAGEVSLQGLTLHVKTDFATIAISSLTDEPIGESDTLLLTAVGRSDNTGAKYDEAHQRQFDFGHAPITIEAIEAQIELCTTRPNLKVWVISDKGAAVTPLPTKYEDGVLQFEIGPQPRWNPSTMYYLIMI
jgi:hypothetical protein